MRIGVLGINHRSADLLLREHVARACHSLCWDVPHVVLSTCNRSEIYFSAEDMANVHVSLLQLLREEIPTSFEHALYTYFGRDCFFHLATVTLGLESAVLAESDIQRQVKIAYSQACQGTTLPSPLHFLFQKSLKLGKLLRTMSPLFHSRPELEIAIFKCTEGFFSSPPSFLFLGNSEINRKIIRYFKRKGISKITLCTRQPHAAEKFSLDYGISLKGWEEIDAWHQFEGVISGTQAEGYLIEKVPEKLHTRLIFDLSVPRTVHPHLDHHPFLRVMNIDELNALTSPHEKDRLHEVSKLQHHVHHTVDRYLEIFERKSSRNREVDLAVLKIDQHSLLQ